MEVTRTNFKEVLKELDDVLEKADFLGIDGEFTGLNSGPETNAFDTPAQYYSKLRSGSMEFLLIQFGLSIFSYNSETNSYTQQSYNFYVFPRPLNRAAPDCRFMCQASSISFLANQGFDFNKLFKLGIPYLTSDEEEKLSKRVEERQRAREEGLELIPISDEDKPQIEDICSRIDEFIDSEAEELTIDRCNAFIRRLVHQEARMRWPNKIRLESKTEGGGQCLVVQKIGTKEEEKQKEVERREKEKREVQEAVGLSALLRKIADSGKLLVGHNMLLDLCHIVHQFFAPLPESYSEFKALIHCLFPRILDTKVICQSPQFRESVLSSNLNILLETVSKAPFSLPEVNSVENRSYSVSAMKSHEAGYDAYITGLCFISLSKYLGSLQNPEVSTVLTDSSLLNPFLNKLLITRLKDFPYIDLTGKDPNPSRDHVFHITFPKKWRFSDVSQLFNPYGGVSVSWLSDTTAYVGLNRRDQSGSVLKQLSKVGNFKIQKYAEHQASLDTSNQLTHGERKRKLSASEKAPSSKEEPKASSVNISETSEDDGWEMASGNTLKLSSNSVYQAWGATGTYQERAKSSRSSENKDVVQLDKLSDTLRSESGKFEQSKVVHKIRLKNTLSLPTDLRNGRASKRETPKYTILRRSPDQLESRNIEDSRPLRPLLKGTPDDLRKMQTTEKIGDAENYTSISTEIDTTDSESQLKHEKLFEMKKESLTRAKSNPISGEKPKTVNSRLKNLDAAALFQKKMVKTPVSTPPMSPKAKRSPKKQAKNKLTDLGSNAACLNILEKSERSEKGEKSEKTAAANEKLVTMLEKQVTNGERQKNAEKTTTKDEQALKKRSNVDDKIELKRPTMKLLRSARKRPENVLITGSLLFRIAQIAGILLLLYVFIIF